MNFMTLFFNDESGATAIEYGLIAGVISLALVVSVTALGTDLSAKFDTIASKFQ